MTTKCYWDCGAASVLPGGARSCPGAFSHLLSPASPGEGRRNPDQGDAGAVSCWIQLWAGSYVGSMGGITLRCRMLNPIAVGCPLELPDGTLVQREHLVGLGLEMAQK